LEDLLVVLVVENDESILSIVEATLTDGGFEPAIASSGEQAVTLLKGSKSKCRALVTDIDLGQGKMDGWEVAKYAREIDPAFPIIYMTGSTDETVRGRALQAGCVAFLTKPFAPPALDEALMAAKRRTLS